jgi:hypothetical protein
MASTFTKKLLSGSTGGKPIKVTGTNTAGAVAVHTPPAGTDIFDAIWLYANNTSTGSVELTVEWGASTDANIVMSIAAKSGLVLVSPGIYIQDSFPVRAYAGSANVIFLTGYVNRLEYS